MASTICQIVWLHRFLIDLGVNLSHPIPLYCNDKSVITRNSVFHKHTQHIEIDCHLTPYHL